MDADETADRIVAGGDGAKQALTEILEGLEALGDTREAEEAGMALFGSMWEDIGGDIIAALDPAEQRLEGFRGTMDSVTAQAYDNVNTRLTGAWRGFVDSVPTALDQAGAIAAIDRIADAFDEDGLAGAIDQVQEEWDAAWPYVARFLHDTVVPTLGQLGAAAADAFATSLVTGMLNKVQEIANFALGGQTIGDQIGLGNLVDLVGGLGGGETPAFEMPNVFGLSSGESGAPGSGGIRAMARGGAVPSPMLALVGDNTDGQPEIVSPVPLMQQAFIDVLAATRQGPTYNITAIPGDDQVERILHRIKLHESAAEVGARYTRLGGGF